MKILIACEESQTVCKEFRKLGHQAFSCDIQDSSGGKPQWHIKGDVFEVIKDKWDMMVAFPPCTHLAVSGAAWFEQKRKDGRQDEGIDFFMKIANADIPKIAIENPVGIMSKLWRKPEQIIQPYFFGDSFSKKTCLWLKNLPLLYHNDHVNLFDSVVTHVDKGEVKNGYPVWMFDNDAKKRSKTFPGIAKAMASQWG